MQLARRLPNMTSNDADAGTDMLRWPTGLMEIIGFKQTSQQAWDNVYLSLLRNWW